MSVWLEYSIGFLVAGLTSIVLTWMLLRVLPVLGFIDVPKENRLHTSPIPRGGGMAIVLSIFLTGLAGVHEFKTLLPILACGLPILVIGLLDDRFGLNGQVKLFAQVLTLIALLLVHGYPEADMKVLINYKAMFIFVFLFGMAIMTGMNLVDGMDGYATGLALISVCAALFLLCTRDEIPVRKFQAEWFLVLVAGGCAGFLLFNKNPAKIFLGDVGGMFLGFAIFYGFLEIAEQTVTRRLVSGFVLMAWLPMADGALAVVRRSLRTLRGGDGVLTRDMEHIHHRMLSRGHSQRKACLILWTIQFAFALLGILTIQWQEPWTLWLPIAAAALFFFNMADVEWKEWRLCLQHWKRGRRA